MVLYSSYGLRLRADRPIPGLVPLPAGPRPDVEIHLGSAPHLPRAPGLGAEVWYASPDRGERGRPTLTVWSLAGGEYLRLRYADGTEFFLQRSGLEVWATWPGSLTLEATVSYLLGPVLGFVLRLRGVIALHASGVAIGGHAAAFLGPPGAGKSTTAAALAGRGHAVLADDVIALTPAPGAYLAQPGYPRLRLWSESLDALRRGPGQWHGLSKWGGRRYHLDLTANGYRFQSRALPLAAIYALADRRADAGTGDVEPVAPARRLMTLVANTFGNYLLDREMRAQEFDCLGRLLARVPLRRIYSHGDLADLPRLCDAICDDVRELTSAESGASRALAPT